MELYETLKQEIDKGKRVAWLDHHSRLHLVTSVHERGNTDESADDWEPGPIAALTGGGYLALDSACLWDFAVIEFLDSPSPAESNKAE